MYYAHTIHCDGCGERYDDDDLEYIEVAELTEDTCPEQL